MELRKPFNIRRFLILSYVLVFALYIIYGLQPAQATGAVSELSIPSIGLTAGAVESQMKDGKLETPDYAPASFAPNENKILLYGHSTAIFEDLNKVRVGDTVEYAGVTYNVTKVQTVAKEKVNMNWLLQSADRETLVLMTCAGTLYGNGDASHRLIVTATSE